LKLTRRRLLASSSAALVVGVAGFGYSDTQDIQLTRIRVGLNSKTVFLVDPHIHGVGDAERRLLELVAEERPDTILMAGDLVDEYTGDLRDAEEYVSNLEAKEKFAVMGNHEYWSGKAGEAARILKSNGFEILSNSSASSSAGRIYGLDWVDERIYPKLEANGLVIVHDPNAAPNISGNCIILAGHTHGGLVLGGIELYSNSLYTRGMYQLGTNTRLYVSRGLGQILPFRFASPLELVVLE